MTFGDAKADLILVRRCIPAASLSTSSTKIVGAVLHRKATDFAGVDPAH